MDLRRKREINEEWRKVVREATKERDEAYERANELPFDLRKKAEAVAEDVYDMRLKAINDIHDPELRRSTKSERDTRRSMDD